MTALEQEGPYTVTIRRACDCDVPALEGDGEHAAGCAIGVVSRRAFVAFDAARAHAGALVNKAAWELVDPPREAFAAWRALGPDGGRVTLPDGTVIEVEKATWSDLAAAVDYLGRGFVREEEWPEVLAAFNASESSVSQESAR